MTDPFYRTRAWLRLRSRKLRLNPNCEWFGRRGPKGMHVDHIESLRRRPDLALDIGNFQTLCDTDHNMAKRRHELDADNPVAGPPISASMACPHPPFSSEPHPFAKNRVPIRWEDQSMPGHQRGGRRRAPSHSTMALVKR
jgi:hypothetical protein